MRSPLLALSFVLLLVAACADDGRRHGGGGDGGNTSDGDGGTNPNNYKCSADLQSVVDASGATVMTCPPDQGCSNGRCIAACDAAAASQGNVGCSFLAATPAFETMIAPPCFAVFLANNWSKPVKITVSRGGMTFDATTFGRIASGSSPTASSWPTVPVTGVPPGEVAVLFLSSDPTSTNAGTPLKCPVAQAINGSTAVAGTNKGVAFSITTDVPVSAYDILPYGGAASYLPAAELLLPTSAWGTNYVAAVPLQQGGGLSAAGPQWGQIVAAEDGTSVQINPTRPLPAGGGVPAAPANTVTTFQLNAGEFFQWEDSGDMSGSVISSNKPVAFIGGTAYLCLTSKTSPEGGGCDSGHQMIPPVSALGSEYAATPFVTRRATLLPESIPYRFVGAVDGTQLTYEPAIPGAPPTLGRGIVVDFESTSPFIVKSQDAAHPFYVAQMMPGCLLTDGTRPGEGGGGGSGLGDEEFVNVLPPAQFLSKYVFFTDPTYATTNLVLTRVKHGGTFADVTLDCAGTIKNWMPVGSGDQYEYAQIDLWRSNMSVTGCTNGPHTAQSDGPFGLVVWGTDTFASYAYPGGGNLGTISTAVIIP